MVTGDRIVRAPSVSSPLVHCWPDTAIYRPTLNYGALFDQVLYYRCGRLFFFSFECFLHYEALKRRVWQELRTSLVSRYRYRLRPALSLCKMVVRGVEWLAHPSHCDRVNDDQTG